MSANNTVQSLLVAATKQLSESSQTPNLDAQLLLCSVLGWSKEKLLTSKSDLVSAISAQQYDSILQRRVLGEPVAYIIGVREFWKHVFLVNPSVLVPRPETELIVERAVTWVLDRKLKDPYIVDIGTGSGCIACSIASELKEQGIVPRVIASDISSEALSVALVNAQKLSVDDCVEFRLGSLFDPLCDLKGKIDLLCSNPPYIAEGDTTISPECRFEPAMALFSGVDGLTSLENIILNLGLHLDPQGAALLEFGQGQEDTLAALAMRQRFNPKFHKDLQGIGRVLELTFV